MYYNTNQQQQYPYTANFPPPPPPYNTNGRRRYPPHYNYYPTANLSIKDQIREFLNGAAEMGVAVAKGCSDIIKQSVVLSEDSFLIRKLGKDSFIANRFKTPYHKLRSSFAFFSPQLTHIIIAFLLAFAGVPGLKPSLLEEFGIRLLTYDLPGFGQSDPHPGRNLQSSASDMSCLAYSLGVKGKFWVLGYSTGSMHAWAALRYIPHRVAGAAMFAPWVNPYDSMMNRDEKYGTWGKWTRRRKFMFFLARRFPKILPFLYYRSFLSGKHDHIDKWLSLSLEERDRTIVEHPFYDEYWQRDIEESTRQGNAKPFVEEAVLQVSNWGFSLGDLKLEKKKRGKGILSWLKYLMSSKEEYTGFLGPIHVWQGMDDRVVPPSMTDFVHRVLPGAAVHKLPYEGHFTYFNFCDECHRQIFTIIFGTPRGPLEFTDRVNQSYETAVENSTTSKDEEDEQDKVVVGDSSSSEENV
ncbi:hypothetical protein ACFE04_007447 [Oxalis oulophora]